MLTGVISKLRGTGYATEKKEEISILISKFCALTGSPVTGLIG